MLEHQIKHDLRRAVGAAPTNFTDALEAPDSEPTQQLVADPYVFEHLAMVERGAEREVEQAPMDGCRTRCSSSGAARRSSGARCA